ncbi:DUF4142 domain-containing protein [Nonomuraea antimicrobica]
MRTRLSLSLGVVTALIALPGCSGGAPADTAAVVAPTGAQPSEQPSEQDKAWMAVIHQGNLAEIGAGRLAREKGTTEPVRSVGELLVKDHTALDAKVTQAATQLGVQLPASMDAGQRKRLNKLEGATGKDLDRGFLSWMIEAHKEALTATEQEISKGSSETVKALAKEAAPSLQAHLDALEKAQKGD